MATKEQKPNSLSPNVSLDTKSLYAEVYKVDGHNYGAFTQNERADERPKSQEILIKEYICKYSISESSTVVELGCGLAHLNRCHPRWRGIEYSTTAIDIARSTYGDSLNIEEADARNLPIETNSVDFLFSFATLEHIPEVEKAFSEIERVLKPNAIAVLAPAWNCRPWTVKKLQQRPYAELKISERLGKFLIPLRENLIFRMLCSIPSRLQRELLIALGRKSLELKYKRLEPDFSLWNRYEHIADDDAFASIDAHAALIFYISRGWISKSHPNFISRFCCRGDEIVLQKM